MNHAELERKRAAEAVVVICPFCSREVPKHEAQKCQECGREGCGGCVRLGNPYDPKGFFCPVDNELAYWRRKEKRR
ncbi:MAG: hypothetical protein ABFE07_29070 [Armatimonadia bacterium]